MKNLKILALPPQSSMFTYYLGYVTLVRDFSKHRYLIYNSYPSQPWGGTHESNSASEYQLYALAGSVPAQLHRRVFAMHARSVITEPANFLYGIYRKTFGNRQHTIK